MPPTAHKTVQPSPFACVSALWYVALACCGFVLIALFFYPMKSLLWLLMKAQRDFNEHDRLARHHAARFRAWRGLN